MKEENEKNKEKWTVEYGSDVIFVENKMSTAKLLVNEKVQDICYGMVAVGNVRLFGKTSDGKKIKAVLGGDLKIHCAIFVDCECLLEI